MPLCRAVGDRFLKAVACSALGALGGTGNVALCPESKMGLHASQLVSSHPCPLFYPPPQPPFRPALLSRHCRPCELNFLLVLSRANVLIEGSSTGRASFLFLAGWQPTSCLPVRRPSFFAHPVACGWKRSLINFKTHPVQSRD